MTTFPTPPDRYDSDDESRFRRYLEQELERLQSAGGPVAGILPAAGDEGQLLAKASGDDFDAEWVDPAGGMWGEPLVDATLGTSTAQWVVGVSGLAIEDEVRVRLLARPTIASRTIYMRVNNSTNAYAGYLTLMDGTAFTPSSTNGITFSNQLMPSASDLVSVQADIFMRKIRDADWLAGHFVSYVWDPSFIKPRAYRGAFEVDMGAGAISSVTVRATGSGSPLVEAGSRVLIYSRSFA